MLSEERKMNTQLLEIEPKELKFLFILKKQCSCSVTLTNNTERYVAFKVKTTSPKKYCVGPIVGIIKPKSVCDFTVTMQAQHEAPPDMICTDKFLIQSMVVRVVTKDKDITLARENGSYIEYNKLKVALVSPLHSPVSSTVNGTMNRGTDHDASIPKEPVFSGVGIHEPLQTIKVRMLSEEGKMNAQLLEIEPKELKFLFILKKQCSCSVTLTNKTNHYVAFKVKTTAPKKYCVRPNVGIIKPKSVCDFTVTMQAQHEAPPDMICEDKFLIQGKVVPRGTKDEDITSAMFVKKSGRYIEDNKLKVALLSRKEANQRRVEWANPLISKSDGV